MKNVCFSLALMLMGSFAFANSAKNSTIATTGEHSLESNNYKKIDSHTFAKMLQNGDLKIVKILKLDTQFKYLDSCGNWWVVQYDSLFFTPLTALIEASAMVCEATGC